MYPRDNPHGETTTVSVPAVRSVGLRAWALVRALRPKQWAKNILVFLPFAFSVHERWSPDQPGEAALLLGQASLTFLLFCLLSSAVYLVNDAVDAPRDRLHPRKRYRPIASGALPVGVAWIAAGLLAVAGVAGSFVLGPGLGGVALIYLASTTAYTFLLKRLVLLDVMALSAGYILRAVAGAVALAAPISPWLYVVTGLGALLIGIGKRRNELALAQGSASHQRPVLGQYTLPLLDQLLAIAATSTLVAYILYTFTAPNAPRNHALMLTIPFVLFGLFRYLYLVYSRNMGEAPEDVLLTDKPILIAVGLWLLTAVVVLGLMR
ncbi:MAG: decaprenyl-phosphate phosphoribosyltransferase [Dehalococcoidia bacterium]|nr:decaprenyl-phosphate phosphoribosyltransferase [Dehalococcoidia bacterium]MDW8120669.1 decaprenyl-phosphate phosphoribosyltransferase [Chloroflexota bacterium]